MNQANVTMQSVNGVRTKVVKGSQNQYVSSNIDANSLAQLEADRVREQELIKKEKIESFMNSTRINASKLYKEQCNKNLQNINSKKEILGKQKQLKAKYTVIPKKTEKIDGPEQVRKLPSEPIQVNWKQAEDAFRKVHIPIQNCEIFSSDNESGYDSEIDKQKNETPEQVTSLRLQIKKQMMQKFKRH